LVFGLLCFLSWFSVSWTVSWSALPSSGEEEEEDKEDEEELVDREEYRRGGT
jgi:hypothetical protein